MPRKKETTETAERLAVAPPDAPFEVHAAELTRHAFGDSNDTTRIFADFTVASDYAFTIKFERVHTDGRGVESRSSLGEISVCRQDDAAVVTSMLQWALSEFPAMRKACDAFDPPHDETSEPDETPLSATNAPSELVF
jgi:hypothetical protein